MERSIASVRATALVRQIREGGATRDDLASVGYPDDELDAALGTGLELGIFTLEEGTYYWRKRG